MRIKLGITAKLLLYILPAFLIVSSLTMFYIEYNTRKLAIDDAEIIAQKTATEKALRIEKQLAESLAVLKTLSQAFSVYNTMSEDEWKPLFIEMYKKVYAQNNFYKLWDSWELKYFDKSWNKDYGRYAVTIFNKNNKIDHSTSIRSENGDNELYAQIKNIALNMIWEPYWDEFLEQGEQAKFMTTISSPIYLNNKFAGLVGADIIMEQLQQITNEINLIQGSKAYLISNDGIFVSHPDLNMVGQKIENSFKLKQSEGSVAELIKSGQSATFNTLDQDNNRIILTISPIHIGEYNNPWSLVLTTPQKAVLKGYQHIFIWSIIGGVVGLVLIMIFTYYVLSNIGKTLIDTNLIMKEMAVGKFNSRKNIDIKRNDELGEISNSLNALKQGLNQTSEFANQIGSGNLNASFTPLGSEDVLGNSLLNMRKSLIEAQHEEEQRKLEDAKLNWSTQGLAKFGEILRSNSTNIKELSFNIMRNLVDYLEVNQGALFIVEKEDGEEPYLELKNAIAYGRDKFMQKRLEIGQSLVGRAAFEMKSIYMTEIPENYIKITSGMGTANPRELLVVPLILNDEVYGVIELASFKKIESHHIEFVEKLGESIASTIASVKVNEKTSQLLERSKGQAEELAAQEEEMRQNLEELQATQEEAARREFEMSGIVNALGATAFTVEYDLDGTILSCNEKYAEMLGISKENIIGQKHKDGYDDSSEMGSNYELFWAELCNGITKKQTNKVTINNRELWVEESYTPIKEPNETKPYKILKIGFDISAQKQRELAMQDQQVEIEKEQMLINEYKNQIDELEAALKKANDTIVKLEKEPKINKTKATPASPDQIKTKASGDNLIDWTTEFVLGISEMDEQHEQLVNIANTLNSSYIQGKNKKEIKENLRSLIDFASYHFGTEEAYFESFGFEDSENHIADHHSLLKELKSIQTAFNANKIKELDPILNFISEWITNHFTNFDRKYAELFKSKGL